MNNGGCDPVSNCTNLSGSYSCSSCPSGYSGTGNTSCIGICLLYSSILFCILLDINECSVKNGGCDLRTECNNLNGSYYCGPCPVGFNGTGSTSCTGIYIPEFK